MSLALFSELQAFIWDSPRLEYEAAYDCDLTTAGDLFGRSGLGIGLPKNSPWTHEVSKAVLEMHESKLSLFFKRCYLKSNILFSSFIECMKIRFINIQKKVYEVSSTGLVGVMGSGWVEIADVDDIWIWQESGLSFLVWSVYNILPSAANLVEWSKSDGALCLPCREKQTLGHVLSTCKVTLGQGQFMWYHNMVVKWWWLQWMWPGQQWIKVLGWGSLPQRADSSMKWLVLCKLTILHGWRTGLGFGDWPEGLWQILWHDPEVSALARHHSALFVQTLVHVDWQSRTNQEWRDSSCTRWLSMKVRLLIWGTMDTQSDFAL